MNYSLQDTKSLKQETKIGIWWPCSSSETIVRCKSSMWVQKSKIEEISCFRIELRLILRYRGKSSESLKSSRCNFKSNYCFLTSKVFYSMYWTTIWSGDPCSKLDKKSIVFSYLLSGIVWKASIILRHFSKNSRQS